MASCGNALLLPSLVNYHLAKWHPRLNHSLPRNWIEMKKRRRPQYHMRERVLLCNTMSEADTLLNKRTRRTNRRVIASEEDDVVGFDKPTYHHHNQHHPCVHHSPLCDNTIINQDDDNSDDDYHSSDDDDATVVAEEIHHPKKIDDDIIDVMTPTVAQAQYNNIPVAFGITTTAPFSLDCRLTEDHLLSAYHTRLTCPAPVLI